MTRPRTERGNEAPGSPSARTQTREQHSAGGLVVADETVLLIQLGPDRWQLPKGRIEPGESPRQAALREIREETGVSCQVGEELGEIEYRFATRSGRSIHKHVTYFLCSYVAGSVEDFDPREVRRAVWMPWQSALDTLTFENEREVVRRARQLLSEAGTRPH